MDRDGRFLHGSRQDAQRQASAGARDGVKGKRNDLAARAPLHALVGRRSRVWDHGFSVDCANERTEVAVFLRRERPYDVDELSSDPCWWLATLADREGNPDCVRDVPAFVVLLMEEESAELEADSECAIHRDSSALEFVRTSNQFDEGHTELPQATRSGGRNRHGRVLSIPSRRGARRRR